MKKHLLLALAASILLASCGKATTPLVPPPTDTTKELGTEQATVIETPTDTSVSADTKTTEPQTTISYTSAEVATHNNAKSCWMILDGRVFDVTSYISKHPGGDSILRGCGKDATQMFSRHPESAKAMKEQFYIGDLK